MTEEMRLIFEKGKWNDKRDTPAAAPPPCRLHFLMFSALHAEKAALLRRKNAFGRTTAFLAPRMPSQNKKAIPYGMTFCFGGDKRDRTADLMTASSHLFVISGTFAPTVYILDTKNTDFYAILSTASIRFRAHLGQNLGQAITLRLKESCGALMHHRSRSRRSQAFSDDVSNPSIKYYYLEKCLNRF